MAADPFAQRRIRLSNDYQTMVNISRDWLKWTVLSGNPPFVEAYELDVKLKTITSQRPEYATKHKIKVELPPGYPASSAPNIVYLGPNRPYHPNWFTSGKWCWGEWHYNESLGQHVVRMLQTLQYDPMITNPKSPANKEASDWYLANSSRSIFPCDTTPMPDPTTGRLKVSVPKKSFSIQ
jgi:ubiquitin-protein ligase